jgi:hypothetical protein
MAKLNYEKQNKIESGKKGYREFEHPLENVMRTYLNVPYSEKEEAKKLGARWDPDKRQWFCYQIGKLKKWFPLVEETKKQKPIVAKKHAKKRNKLAGFSVTTIGADYIESNDTSCPWA